MSPLRHRYPSERPSLGAPATANVRRTSRTGLLARGAAALGLAAGVLLAPVTPVSASPSTPAAPMAGPSAGEFVSAINAERSARGLPALAFDGGSSAQCAADAYKATGQPHPPGCDWSTAFPTLEASYSGSTSGNAVRGWMGSDVHRKIIMNPGGEGIRVGVACADGILFAVVQVSDPDFDWDNSTPAASPVVTPAGSGSGCPSTPPPPPPPPPPPTTQAPTPTTQAPPPPSSPGGSSTPGTQTPRPDDGGSSGGSSTPSKPGNVTPGKNGNEDPKDGKNDEESKEDEESKDDESSDDEEETSKSTTTTRRGGSGDDTDDGKGDGTGESAIDDDDNGSSSSNAPVIIGSSVFLLALIAVGVWAAFNREKVSAFFRRS